MKANERVIRLTINDEVVLNPRRDVLFKPEVKIKVNVAVLDTSLLKITTQT